MTAVSLGKTHYRNNFLCWLFLCGFFSSATTISLAEEHGNKSNPWSTSVANATQIARETGRPILVYVKATHCGYCRKMTSESWADPRVNSLAQTQFVPLQLDAERDADIIERLRVRAFPTTLVFSATGSNLARFEGYLPPARLLGELQRIDQAGSGSR